MEENLDENLEGNKLQSYYDSKGKKIGDTLIGFFGGLFAYMIIAGIVNATDSMGTLVIVLSIIAYFVAVIMFSVKGRKFITVGLVLLAVIPLIVLGGCLLVMG